MQRPSGKDLMKGPDIFRSKRYWGGLRESEKQREWKQSTVEQKTSII